ncbi:SirB2 family protein [Agaribacterium haliotis]|uniref:SirB2 family protein n=1 Tax=Agaribacterium haliotis TaxID=2013869 RepID=UPI000BB535E2|nr:SirB2 family protein [Agaribacterium haliotis]
MSTLFVLLKHLHVWLVLLSLGLFCIRLSWLNKHSHLLKRRLVKILPHAVDTLLALTGLGMLLLLNYQSAMPGWLSLKLFLLLAYIVFGWLAMHRKPLRKLTIALALGCFAGMIYLAVNKPLISVFDL